MNNGVKMYKNVIEAGRECTSHKIDVDTKKIYEAMKILLALLKPKYANKFYYYDKEFSTFMKVNNDENIESLNAYHSHFFGNDYIKIFGVKAKDTEGIYEYTYFNMVDEIPIAFKTDADNNMYKLKNMIDDINNDIKAELVKIFNKEDRYLECINKSVYEIKAINSFRNSFNDELLKSNIVKKTSKKIKQFYKYAPLKIKATTVKSTYHCIKVSIQAEIEPYVYDRCVDIEFTRDTIYLGNLILDYDGKHKFEPNITNQKYFTNEITSIKYMRNTFKKYLIVEEITQ